MNGIAGFRRNRIFRNVWWALNHPDRLHRPSYHVLPAEKHDFIAR